MVICKSELDIEAYYVSGVVKGLEGEGLVLALNSTQQKKAVQPDVDSGSDAPVSDVAFTFPMAMGLDSPYEITVHRQPADPEQKCIVTQGGSGDILGPVDNVIVTCKTAGKVKMDLSGLNSEGTLVNAILVSKATGEKIALIPTLGIPAGGVMTFLYSSGPKTGQEALVLEGAHKVYLTYDSNIDSLLDMTDDVALRSANVIPGKTTTIVFNAGDFSSTNAFVMQPVLIDATCYWWPGDTAPEILMGYIDDKCGAPGNECEIPVLPPGDTQGIIATQTGVVSMTPSIGEDIAYDILCWRDVDGSDSLDDGDTWGYVKKNVGAVSLNMKVFSEDAYDNTN